MRLHCYVYTADMRNRKTPTSPYPSKENGSGSLTTTGGQNVLSPPLYFSLPCQMQVVQGTCQPLPSQPIKQLLREDHINPVDIYFDNTPDETENKPPSTGKRRYSSPRLSARGAKFMLT